jgi:peptide/nickel transport system substrate-binding protein
LVGTRQLNPAVNGSLRANGRAGGRGWPTSPQLEKLRDRWLVATSLGEQQQLADDIQRQALFDVPYYWRMDGRLDNDRLYVGLNSIS